MNKIVDGILATIRGDSLFTAVALPAQQMMPLLPEKSFDAAMFDPPYPGIKRDYGEWDQDVWMGEFPKLILDHRRLLKPSGSLAVVLQPTQEVMGRVGPWIYGTLYQLACAWNIVQDAYWLNYICLPSAGATRHGLMRGVMKHIVWLGDPDCYRNQQEILWGESEEGPLRRAAERCCHEASKDVHKSPSGHKRDRMKVHAAAARRGGVTPFNVWPIANNRAETGHGAETPIELARRWIRYICPPGGVILDACCGGGNIGVAAIREGRRYVGFEKFRPAYEKAIVALTKAAKEATGANHTNEAEVQA